MKVKKGQSKEIFKKRDEKSFVKFFFFIFTSLLYQIGILFYRAQFTRLEMNKFQYFLCECVQDDDANDRSPKKFSFFILIYIQKCQFLQMFHLIFFFFLNLVIRKKNSIIERELNWIAIMIIQFLIIFNI